MVVYLLSINVKQDDTGPIFKDSFLEIGHLGFNQGMTVSPGDCINFDNYVTKI